jgi:hypothetical protein
MKVPSHKNRGKMILRGFVNDMMPQRRKNTLVISLSLQNLKLINQLMEWWWWTDNVQDIICLSILRRRTQHIVGTFFSTSSNAKAENIKYNRVPRADRGRNNVGIADRWTFYLLFTYPGFVCGYYWHMNFFTYFLLTLALFSIKDKIVTYSFGRYWGPWFDPRKKC